jgi:hypothetical protein
MKSLIFVLSLAAMLMLAFGCSREPGSAILDTSFPEDTKEAMLAGCLDGGADRATCGCVVDWFKSNVLFQGYQALILAANEESDREARKELNRLADSALASCG